MRSRLNLTRREQRLIKVAGIVVALAILARLVPLWAGSMQRAQTAAAERSRELREARAVIASSPTLRDSLVERNTRYLALAGQLLPGDSPGAAGAALASLVSAAATGAGLEMGSVQIRSDTAAGAYFDHPTVRGDARGDIKGVTQFLVVLERGPPLLRVRQLNVTQPEPGAGDDRPENLRIEFVVGGLALKRAQDTPQDAVHRDATAPSPGAREDR